MSPAASAPVFSHLPRPLTLPPTPMLSTLLLRHRLTAAAAAASSPTRSPLRVLAAAAGMSSSASASASSSSPHGGRKPNRLAAEHSPYLLQHAHNPVRSALLFVRAAVSSPRGRDSVVPSQVGTELSLLLISLGAG
jgi:hypothetical protein